MIEIDGSMGYGQVLRTAIALSALTLKPIKIYNIRVRRPKPGLRPQHLKGVLEAGRLVHAEIKGAKIGSTSIEFLPKKEDIPSKIFIDIGTAGSVTLLLQTILPIIIGYKKKTTIRVIGGTDVKGAPTVMYYKKIFFYYLERMGIRSSFEIKRHGFYPKGGGEIILKLKKVEDLKPLKLLHRGAELQSSIWSIASLDLKKRKVAERQIKGFLAAYKGNVSSHNFAYVDTDSTGSSIFAEVEFENCKIGMDMIGEKKKRAEEIGRELAEKINSSIKSGACLDRFMSDQIVPYIALASGESVITVEEKTEHFVTNVKVCEKMLGVKFEIDKNKVKVKGLNYG